MNVHAEFSRSAAAYEQYNIIQQQVARKLVHSIGDAPQKILDIGCGSGAVFKAIDWELEHFVALDFSESMLSNHPTSEHITCKLADFNNTNTFETMHGDFDRIISASALQWALHLDTVFASIAALNAPISLAIFTCNTFRSLYECAKLKPILRCSDEVTALAKKHFDAHYETVTYTLAFESPREMFGYIKKSGVSGGRRVLSYQQTKRLMQEYPHDYLEFEVLFISN